MDLLVSGFSLLEKAVGGVSSGFIWVKKLNAEENIAQDYMPQFNDLHKILIFAFAVAWFLFFMAWMSKSRENFIQKHRIVVEQPVYGKRWLRHRAEGRLISVNA